MSAYVFKVTGKIGTDSKGRKANIIEFAYKPYFGWDTDKLNNRMFRESGCYNANRYVARGKTYTGRIMMEHGSDSIAWGRGAERGTIMDTHFDDIWHREYRANNDNGGTVSNSLWS